MQNNLEMVICPVCGKPFPKKRKDLGYNYCVNCSTEKSVSCIVEGSMEGDGDDTVHSNVIIVSQDQYKSIENFRQKYHGNKRMQEEDFFEDSDQNSFSENFEEEELPSGFSKKTEEELERMEQEDSLDAFYFSEDEDEEDSSDEEDLDG